MLFIENNTHFFTFFCFLFIRIRLTCLNEEIGIEEHGTGEADTYNDVMDDFSRFTVSQLHRIQRSKTPFD